VRSIYYITNPGGQLPVAQEQVKAIGDAIESLWMIAIRSQSSWSLNHRLFRQVPPDGRADDTRPPQAYSYQHLLHVSHVTPDRTAIVIQSPSQPATSGKPTVVSIPLGHTDAHSAMLVNQMALLWVPQRIVEVVKGKAYTFPKSDMEIRFGELRARRQGPQTTSITSPGIVLDISLPAGIVDDGRGDTDLNMDSKLDFDVVQESIRGAWRALKERLVLGRSEVREVMQLTKDVDGKDELAHEVQLSLWCEALSVRS